MEHKVELYVSYCTPTVGARKAKAALESLLDVKGVPYVQYDVGIDPARKEELATILPSYSLPQLLVNGAPLGSTDKILSLEEAGELDRLLFPPASPSQGSQ